MAAIVGAFLLLNLYLRKRMIAKHGRVDGGSIILGGMLSPTQSGKGSLV
jgi:hypothetical protein